MKKILLKIEGMTCSACSTGLEKYLNKQNGIEIATVNLIMATANIEYDETTINIEQIENFIKDAGFKFSTDVKMYFNVVEQTVYVVADDGKQLKIEF